MFNTLGKFWFDLEGSQPFPRGGVKSPMLVTLPRTQGKKSRRQQEPRVVYFGIDNKIMLWRLVNVCVSQVIV